MEEARIKMVGDESWAKENVVTGILRLVRENGIFSTFGGLPAMLCKQVSDALTLLLSLIHYEKGFRPSYFAETLPAYSDDDAAPPLSSKFEQ